MIYILPSYGYEKTLGWQKWHCGYCKSTDVAINSEFQIPICNRMRITSWQKGIPKSIIDIWSYLPHWNWVMSRDDINLPWVLVNLKCWRRSIFLIREAVDDVFGWDNLFLDRGLLLWWCRALRLWRVLQFTKIPSLQLIPIWNSSLLIDLICVEWEGTIAGHPKLSINWIEGDCLHEMSTTFHHF